MKYNIGDIVYHNLTNEKFMVIRYGGGRTFICRGEDYCVHEFEEAEIRPPNPPS